MLTRIGDLGRSQRLTATLLATQARVRADEQAVASGKIATSYGQIAGQAGLLARAHDSRRLASALVEQNERLGSALQAADSALGGVIAVAERARTLLVQRLDGAAGADVPLAAEAQAMLAEIAGQLNATYDGSYLFAGSRDDAAPVVLPATPVAAADPALYYRGDAVRSSARIGRGVELEHGILASDPPFAELMAALGTAQAAHAADDRGGLQAALSAVGDALDGLVDLRGGLGVGTARLESTTEAQRSSILYLDQAISGVEDTDLPEVMSRLARDQANLQAAYLVAGRLGALSLADYLR